MSPVLSFQFDARLTVLRRRRLLLLKSVAAIAAMVSILGLLVGLLIEPDPIVRRALDLHGLGGLIPVEVLAQMGWMQLLLAALGYALAFFDNRYALLFLISNLALSVLTHLFGGLGVSAGFVSLADFSTYVAEGFMLALLLMREPRQMALSEPGWKA